jgi:DNA-directed RNA polymerase specialized sigma24 family protein
VIELRWRHQLSHAEIAETLGITRKGVEVQITRGLRALRDALSG